MIEDLKQVRDALDCIISVLITYPKDEVVKFMVKQASESLDTLDRIIAGQTHTPQGWSAIETAPKDGTEILLALWSGHPEHKTSFCWAINGYYKDGFFYSKDPMIGKLTSPTHWQHITAPTPAQPEKVDVEALKKSDRRVDYPNGLSEQGVGRILGWNECIDHLSATGRLKV